MIVVGGSDSPCATRRFDIEPRDVVLRFMRLGVWCPDQVEACGALAEWAGGRMRAVYSTEEPHTCPLSWIAQGRLTSRFGLVLVLGFTVQLHPVVHPILATGLRNIGGGVDQSCVERAVASQGMRGGVQLPIIFRGRECQSCLTECWRFRGREAFNLIRHCVGRTRWIYGS